MSIRTHIQLRTFYLMPHPVQCVSEGCGQRRIAKGRIRRGERVLRCIIAGVAAKKKKKKEKRPAEHP